jgi:putative transposase
MNKRRSYATDLTNRQWSILAPLVPEVKPGGRPAKHPRREIINGILYLVRSGGAWRLLPHDLPPWSTVHWYYRCWRRDGTWQRMHDALRAQARRKAGRAPQPRMAILDSQSVKTTARGGVRGYDAGKRITGRKRHMLVDSCGFLLALVVHAGNIQDRVGAKRVFEQVQERYPYLKEVYADGGYSGTLRSWLRDLLGWTLTIVLRSASATGFEVLPKRWLVERTFGWLHWWRRLSKDYEFACASSEAMIQIAMIHLMLRRLARR